MASAAHRAALSCSDMLKKCELHQGLPDLLVPVLAVGADVPAKKT